MLLKSFQKCALIPGAVALSLLSTSLSSSAEEAPKMPLQPSAPQEGMAQQQGGPQMIMRMPDGRLFGVTVGPDGRMIMFPIAAPKPSKLQENANLIQSVVRRVYQHAYIGIDEPEILHRLLKGFPKDILGKAGLFRR